MDTNSAARARQQPDASPRSLRRVLVVGVLAGYPLFVAAWVGLPELGVTGLVWTVVVAGLGLGVMLGAFGLYGFQTSMAHVPDAQLDERQIAIRDRAYLVSYRILATFMLLGIFALSIAPDVLDRPLVVTFETMQPLMWGALLYSLILPSAVIAWQEPDLPGEG
jgi:Ca2+/Na+ antiporter